MAKRRSKLTDIAVGKLRSIAGKQFEHYDSVVPRLYVRVSSGGTKSWGLFHYIGGRPKWVTLGRFPEMRVKAARDAARTFQMNPDAALAKAEVGTFAEIADQFMLRYVNKKGLRSAGDIKRHLDYALKHWKHREFLSIKRRDVADLLDKIEDERGSNVAEDVRLTLGKMMRWFETRDGTYTCPIVAGMVRAAPKARERILNDNELRALWAACDELPVFGDFLRVLLLTGQRRQKVAEMRWADIGADGVWTIPTAPREKVNPGALTLPPQVREIIQRQPRLLGCDYVFAGRTGGFINGFNKRKATIDAKLPSMPGWVLHDLRRTARSLMSRAGMRPDIAERVLGHAIGGVEGVYDRHSYDTQKAEALKALASLIENILREPRATNVVPLTREIAEPPRAPARHL